MAHFACQMISKTCDAIAKRFISLGEMKPVDFIDSAFSTRPKTQGPRNRRPHPWLARRTSHDFATVRRRDSGIAPQAIEIARNGLGEKMTARLGAAGKGEPIGRIPPLLLLTPAPSPVPRQARDEGRGGRGAATRLRRRSRRRSRRERRRRPLSGSHHPSAAAR